MKKLVIATDNYAPRWDGISRFLSEIVPRLSDKFDITIIAPDYGKTKQKGYIVKKIPLKNIIIGDFQPPQRKYGKIKQIINDADIVFTQTQGFIGMPTFIAASFKHKPLVAFIHNIEWELVPKSISIKIAKKFLYPFTKMVTRFVYNNYDLLIVPSHNISEILRWEKIMTPKKVVHLGVDTKKFVKGNKESAKKKIGLKTEDFVIGYHGRLGREKDLKTLMRAFVRLKSDYKNIKLLIVGSGTREIEDLFKNKEGVIYPGPKEDVVPWIQAMDVFVLTSLTETTSLSTLEAMSCETPVIATKVGFVNDYIQDGENGLFFKKSDPFDLSKKLKILIEDSKLREQFGQRGRQAILEEFSWDITAKRIGEAIEKVSNK